jgi:hypothetical protein
VVADLFLEFTWLGEGGGQDDRKHLLICIIKHSRIQSSKFRKKNLKTGMSVPIVVLLYITMYIDFFFSTDGILSRFANL